LSFVRPKPAVAGVVGRQEIVDLGLDLALVMRVEA
jgi:hypothetical protein